MRISQIAGSFILGTVATLGLQNTQAENKSAVDTQSKSVTDENSRSVQKEITLLEEDLKKLHGLWLKISSEDGLTRTASELIKPHLEKTVKLNIDALLTNDPRKQSIAINNLVQIQEQFTSSRWIPEAENLVNATKYSAPFFNQNLQSKKNASVKELETLTNAGDVLLHLSKNNSEHHKKFADWLNLQIENTFNNTSNEKKEKQKILEAAIKKEISTLLHKTERTESFEEQLKSLTNNYIKIIEQNNSDYHFLNNGLDGFKEITWFVYRYELLYNRDSYRGNNKVKTELHDTLVHLFDVILDGINKLPKEKSSLFKVQLFSVLSELHLYEDRNQLDIFVEKLSNLYCKNQENTNNEEFIKITDSLMKTYEYENNIVIGTFWPQDMMSKFINDNYKYFEININHIIEALKNSKDGTNKRKYSEQLINLYVSFSTLFNTTKLPQIIHWTPTARGWCGGPIDSKLEKEILKIKNWFNEKLEKQAFEAILFSLKDNIEDWKSFSKQIKTIAKNKLNLINKTKAEVVLQKLQEDKSSSNRKIYCEALESVVSSDDANVVHFLKEYISKEDPLLTSRELGKFISVGALNSLDKEQNSNFYTGINDSGTRSKLNIGDLSPFHKLNLDLVRILDGNRELYKNYLPHCTFKTQKDYEDIMKLRKNAFFILAFTISNSSEYSSKRTLMLYQNLMLDLLEKRFERYGPSGTIIEIWGEQTAALIDAYSATQENLLEKTTYINSKLDFLKKRFFDGIEETHKIEGEKRTYITVPLFNTVLEHEFIQLNPKENRKLLDNIYRIPKFGEKIREEIFKEAPALKAKYTDMRKHFGIAFVKALSTQNNGYLDEHLNYLKQLGFMDSEIKSVVESN